MWSRDAAVQGTMPRVAAFTQALCADVQGFSLRAAVRYSADERRSLKQLCRYITRPARANERVQCNAAGQVALRLKTPWRDCTTHLVMSPLEFMQRLISSILRSSLKLRMSVSGLSISTARCLVWVAMPSFA